MAQVEYVAQNMLNCWKVAVTHSLRSAASKKHIITFFPDNAFSNVSRVYMKEVQSKWIHPYRRSFIEGNAEWDEGRKRTLLWLLYSQVKQIKRLYNEAYATIRISSQLYALAYRNSSPDVDIGLTNIEILEDMASQSAARGFASWRRGTSVPLRFTMSRENIENTNSYMHSCIFLRSQLKKKRKQEEVGCSYIERWSK